MNFINGFEIMCYIIVAILLIDLIKHKDYDSLFTFGSAAIVGYVMELAAVAITDIYYYNPNFYINLGFEPYQFPFFGGLMWGGLTVYGIKLAKKLKFNDILTAFSAGMLIVTMDLLLDVVAIRLDGGFWTWVGNPINLNITQHTFMSVIWVNFVGYLIETPTVVYLTLQKNISPTDYKQQFKSMVQIALKAILVTSVGSLTALLLNYLTNDWFSCLLFISVWLILALIILKQLITLKLPIEFKNHSNYPCAIFWLGMYGYCLIGILYLGIHTTYPWFLIAGIGFMLLTIYLSLCKKNDLH